MIEYTAVPGDYLKPDMWLCGDALQASGDDFSTLRLPTGCGGPIKSLAVKIKVTGRKIHWQAVGYNWVTVKVIFIGDGEPDTVTGGRLYSPNL